MGKKSKKRRRKKLSSSSSEDDEKSSKDQDVTRKHKRAKRNQDVTSQKSGADKRDNSASPTIKDVFQSTRHIKKPIYRLSKTQATDQKPAKKEEKCTKAGSVTVPFHEGDCSSKTKHDISGKYYSASRSKSVERGSSKPSNTNSAITVPQRTEKTSKGSSDKKSSQRSPSKLKTQLMSPGIVSAEQKERAPDVLRRKGRAEETPRTGKDSNSVKTREQSKTLSVSKESARQKRIELVKERHKRHPEINPKTPCSDAKSFSAYPRTQSSPSAKHTTSVSSSDVVKKIISTSEKVKSVSHEAAKPSSAEQQTCSTPLPLKFKIPKIVQPRPVDSTSQNYNAKSTNVNLKWGDELSNSKKETVQQAHSCLDATPSVSSEEQDKRSSLSGQQLPATFVTLTEQWQDEMQVVEELHLARSERRLELDVLQSYGELTCMEIDLPEEGAPDTHCKQPPQQDLILVLDTNILLSHLDYVKKISSHGLGAMGFPVVLIPWVVLQEMDSLKKGRGLSGSVAHLAIPAISYIYSSLKSREPHLWGQSMQQAAESSNGLNAENNDDRVLQCCLQYQSLYPECALILCTNDKNLCSKALLSGVKAFSKNDLEAEAGGSTHCFRPLQNIKPLISPQVTSPMLSTKHTSAQPHSQERTGLSAGLAEKDNKRLSKKEDEDKTKWDLIRCVSELEDCLRDVLSNVLQVEMKAAYEELWLEIIYLKPPWSLLDILHCLKKHWIAVFGHIVPRRKQQTVTNLIDFFNSGDTADRAKILAALQDAKELVDAFWKSSSRAAGAYSILNNIENKLQSESESPACDVIMNDDNEDTQPTSSQVSHQEVWALFENIWSNVYQISLEVFKALGFDPHTMQSAQPVGGSPPPQDAVVCLHKLSSMVSQLLQAFSSVLSSAPGLEEVQMLLSIILTNKIVDVDSRLTAKDLFDCFSQEDYREKLRVGGNQLMELKGALDRCIGITGQHTTFPS